MEDLLRTLVAFRTVDGDFDANASAIGFIDSYLKARGLKPEILTFGGYQNLYVSTTGSKTTKVMLAAHVDVVPGPEEMFEMKAHEGKLSGRGVFDMKFSIAAFLTAIDELKDELDQYDFSLLITPDEEVGSPNGVPRMIEAGYLPTGTCVLPDGADGQNWDIETFAKGAWWVEFSAKGKRAHGSRPWNGDNAIDRILNFVAEVKTLFPPVSKEFSTVNVGKINGGEAINQVASFANVSLDMRYPNIEEQQRLRTEVVRLSEKYELEQKDIDFIAPVLNDFEDKYLQSFAAAVKQVTGNTSKPWGTPAGTDARFFTARGLPVIICVPPGGAHHSDDEWIDEQGFELYKDVVISFLRASAKR